MEARAAAAAAYVLNARAVLRDLGGQQIRDFDLVRADGSLEPLEITLAADQTTRQTWARIDALDRDCPRLKRAWTLSVPTAWPDSSGNPGPFNARDFRLAAEPLLVELERLSVSDFNTARWTPDPRTAEDVIAQLVALGCDLGMSHELPEGESGRIYLGSGAGGFVNPDSVATAIEYEAAKADNLAKLREPADAPDRHLFVIVDGSAGGAFPAASHGDLGRLPVLPVPITTAWAAGSALVHVVTPPEGWTSHRIPDDVFDHPEEWIDLP